MKVNVSTVVVQVAKQMGQALVLDAGTLYVSITGWRTADGIGIIAVTNV